MKKIEKFGYNLESDLIEKHAALQEVLQQIEIEKVKIKEDILRNKDKEKCLLSEIPQIIHVSIFQIK